MGTREVDIEFDCLDDEDREISVRSADWDDSVLIHAYDKAMNKVKAEVARKKNIALNGPLSEIRGKSKYQKAKKKAKNQEKWKVGEYCQSMFSEDGITYEAIIIDISESEGACVVRYVGYGNEEEVAIDSLLPSQGRLARLEQEKLASGDIQASAPQDDEYASYSEEDSVRSRYGKHSDRVYRRHSGYEKESAPAPPYCHYSPSHAPPPSAIPPPFLFDREGSEDDKLYSMLLSWYMSGYHTGFYLGSRQASRFRNSCDCNHQCH